MSADEKTDSPMADVIDVGALADFADFADIIKSMPSKPELGKKENSPKLSIPPMPPMPAKPSMSQPTPAPRGKRKRRQSHLPKEWPNQRIIQKARVLSPRSRTQKIREQLEAKAVDEAMQVFGLVASVRRTLVVGVCSRRPCSSRRRRRRRW